MFTFLLGALGGAALGGSYVLLRTPRSGEENQRLVKDYVETTQANIQDVSDKANNLQQSMHNLTTEVELLQVNFIPEVSEIAGRFKDEADMYTRRINDEIETINREVEHLNERIDNRKTSGN